MKRKAVRLSQPKHKVIIQKDVRITMRDGSTLFADIFRPQGKGKFPAIVNISCYQKDLSLIHI